MWLRINFYAACSTNFNFCLLLFIFFLVLLSSLRVILIFGVVLASVCSWTFHKVVSLAYFKMWIAINFILSWVHYVKVKVRWLFVDRCVCDLKIKLFLAQLWFFWCLLWCEFYGIVVMNLSVIILGFLGGFNEDFGDKNSIFV